MQQSLLNEIFNRVAAMHGDSIFFFESELNLFSRNESEILKSEKLLIESRPASSVICSGCEEACVRPIEKIRKPSGDWNFFVLCDQRSDINRVPITKDTINQLHCSGEIIANFLAKLLNLNRPQINNISNSRWPLGVFKGLKHSGHLELTAQKQLSLFISGHSIPLIEILNLSNNTFSIDRQRIVSFADNPVAGEANPESVMQRAIRIRDRTHELKLKGVKGFLKTVAEEEGISIQRLKQIIKKSSTS